MHQFQQRGEETSIYSLQCYSNTHPESGHNLYFPIAYLSLVKLFELQPVPENI